MATVILKATENCNARCRYCDVVHHRRAGGTMSPQVLEQVFRRLGEWLAADASRRINLIWHGGEPLLLGADYFRQAWMLQQKHCPGGERRIDHAIQTNLTLLDGPMIEQFRRMGIGCLGSSYDPEPGIRGIGPRIDSARYNDLFMRGLALARRHGIGCGLIYVVTSRSLARPLEIFEFLMNLDLAGGIVFNPVLVYGEERELAITPAQFADFLGAIFPHWLRRRERHPNCEPFRSFMQMLEGKGLALGCGDSGGCAFEHVTIAPGGGTSHCGRSLDWGLLNYGDIFERTLEQILSDAQRQTLAARNQLLPQTDCRDCRLWFACHGGCPLDAWSAHQTFLRKSEWCEARRGFIERYLEPITGRKLEPHAVQY